MFGKLAKDPSIATLLLDGAEDRGPSAPAGTPAAVNLHYEHNGNGTAGAYFKNTPSQNEQFAGPNHHWATIAVEIKHP